ncbi:molybdopterin converting factor subunit 1 [Terrilactibacillus sp. BCM23-1]|uniref:Molybdopterin synthase sulfur carrier subunit n=1 Tax=Terrilactibacillus tamarindi TaxID=2599694 RepID=A0A6N8CPA5_9BACI|nr:molybdopterin converting factor subunit 1 [Terrilactibacillus tamarindi]MTT31831.1 molybdopterin converting factor subunit 1 [Terrilactibacillus tamarindi]
MFQVLLFAHLREQVGSEKLAIREKQLTVKEFKELMENQYKLPTQGVMIAINEKYATETDIIAEGDTVALIPPVSGG